MSFKISDRFGPNFFGGPGQYIFKGQEFGPKKLHHIASLSINDVGLNKYDFGSIIPLYYGMCYDGCELKYKFNLYNKITIEHISPKQSSSNWPYEDYPNYLPYYPLCIDKTYDVSNEIFLERVCQSICEIPEQAMIIVIPPNPTLGVSMWGADGDAEEIELVFIFDTDRGVIQTSNVCS